MRLKILFALLIFTLVAGQVVYGQSGYVPERPKDLMTVAQYANNALVTDITFRRNGTNEDPVIIDADSGDLTITISYGLLITNYDAARGDDTAELTLKCTAPGYTTDCASTVAEATISNKGGTGVIEITVPSTNSNPFRVAGIRVDASSLALEDEIVATISSTTSPGQVPIGGSTGSGGVSGAIGVVAAGLKVTAVQASSLACSDTELASITVAEGFSGAWGPTDSESSATIDTQTASVKIVLDNLPDGASVKWPPSVEHKVDVSDTDTEQLEANGKLTKDDAESSSNGMVVVYNYERITQYGDAGSESDFVEDNLTGVRSFTIKPDEVNFGSDASVDIAAMLFPSADRSTEEVKLNLESKLSFEAELQNPMDDDGNNTGEGWLVISECVTYLLYPFVTCGATPGWSTGISVSNTSADGNVFGAFDRSTEQSGSVVMYGFPSDPVMSADGEVEPMITTVSTDLAAGATVVVECSDTTMAGMNGYAIIRAAFQHARGMAFVMGNFADGASVDVSHGYMAEVIDNPDDRSQKIE